MAQHFMTRICRELFCSLSTHCECDWQRIASCHAIPISHFDFGVIGKSLGRPPFRIMYLRTSFVMRHRCLANIGHFIGARAVVCQKCGDPWCQYSRHFRPTKSFGERPELRSAETARRRSCLRRLPEKVLGHRPPTD